MISFDPLLKLLAERNLSLYRLEKDYGFSKTTLYKLKDNGNVEMIILNDLCKTLGCKVEDIIVYIEDPEEA